MRLFIFAFVVAVSSCAPAAPPPPPPDGDDPEDVVDPACTALADRLSESFASVRDQIGGRGALAIQMGSCAPLTEVTDSVSVDDLHRIGSVTKTYVAASAVSLSRDGLLDLDADARDLIGEIVDIPAGITVRMLLRHQSGIPEYLADRDLFEQALDDPSQPWDLAELVARGLALGSDFEPGTSWSYSNTNYLALGLVLEHATGDAWPTVVHQRAIDKAGLTSTFVDGADDHIDPAPGSANGHDATFALHPSFPASAGNMLSTAADGATWIRALHATDAVLDDDGRAALVDTVEIDDGVGYGLGTMTFSAEVASVEAIGHDGSIPGYVTLSFYLPAADAGVFAVVDDDSGDPNALFIAAIEALGL